MTEPVLYHNPRCSKSRATKALLESENFSFTTIEYLIEPPSEDQLKQISESLGGARSLLRTNEPDYKALGLDDDFLTDDQIIEALVEHPHLMTRPILVIGNKAAIGRPPEQVLEIL